MTQKNLKHSLKKLQSKQRKAKPEGILDQTVTPVESQEAEVTFPKSKHTFWKKLLQVLGFLLVILVVLFLVVAYWAKEFLHSVGVSPQFAYSLVAKEGTPLKIEAGKTNILLMGIGGANHEGGTLTDTMLLASYDYPKNSLGLISLPRDIWSDMLKDKINSAYTYGEQREKGGGQILASDVIQEVTGLSVQYTILMDFGGFEKIIDQVGGIDVLVEKGFTDPEFPIAGKENDMCEGDYTYKCRYTEVTYNAGLQHMNGEKALTYIRSRHAEGDEGTDFARGRRQQEVILALKKKFTTPRSWWPLSNIQKMYEAGMATMTTSMTVPEMLTFAKYAYKVPSHNIHRISLEDQFEMGQSWKYDGRYVLVPVKNFDAVHAYIQEKLK